MYIKTKLVTSFLIIFLFLSLKTGFSQGSGNSIKVAYIYRFIENIEWQNESSLKVFTIVYLGTDNTYLSALKQLSESKKIRKKDIIIRNFSSADQINNTEYSVLIIDIDYNSYLEKVFDNLPKQNVLLISDGYENRKYVMLNFIYNKSSELSFEINKKTIEDQSLKILPKLLLLGGTELDVRELYKQQEQELNKEKQIVEQQKKELEIQKVEIQKQKDRIEKLNKEIIEKEASLKKQKQELELQLIKLKEQDIRLSNIKKEVEEKEKLLIEKIKAISEQELLISEQKKKVEQSKEQLSELDTEIAEKQKLINLKEQELGKKDQKIDNQRSFIYFTLGVLFIILIFSVLLIRSIRKTRKANIEIQRQKTEITQANEELLVKSENLAQANDEILAKTDELFIKNIEINRSYENLEKLSIIGQKITSTLDIDSIIEISHQNTIQLIPSSEIFAVGLLDSQKNCINFKHGYNIQKKSTIPEHDENMSENFLAVYSLKNSEQIFINDFENESGKFIEFKQKERYGISSKSLIYIPLFSNENKLGIITIQSSQKNAFTEYHLNILSNFAIYTAIAITNANQYVEIQKQKSLVELQHNSIKSSINYAQRIQNAVLTPKNDAVDFMPEHFVMLKPCEVVSGDFYWLEKIGDKFIIVAADCTGHGVPGAFTSLLGIFMMKEVLNKHEDNLSTDIILNDLRDYMKQMLGQKSSGIDTKDGMDIAFCILDLKTSVLQYSGAYNPLYMIRKDEFIEVKATKNPIGYFAREIPFEKHEIKIEKGDTFYIFSDGYADQIGENGRKMMRTKFKDILEQNHKKTLSEQKNILENNLKKWQGGNNQTDDILVIGFRI